VLNPKRADAEGSRSRADGSKRVHYSYPSPTPDFDTPTLFLYILAQAKAEPNEAKYLSKENSNKYEFSAQILADCSHRRRYETKSRYF